MYVNRYESTKKVGYSSHVHFPDVEIELSFLSQAVGVQTKELTDSAVIMKMLDYL